MAGNGSFYILVQPFPVGQDMTQRDTVIEGAVVPVITTTGTLQNITGFSITSNVATFNVANSYTTGGGDTLIVAGFFGALAYLNGQYTTNSATASTVLVPLTHANVAQTTVSGVSTIAPTYTTGGLPFAGFVQYQGLVTGVGTIGPKNNPHYVHAQTNIGSACNYKTNLSVSPWTLKQYTGITETTPGAALASDSIYVRAEFTKNAY